MVGEVAGVSRLARYIGWQLARLVLVIGAAVAAAALALDGLERAALLLEHDVSVATAATYLGLRLATAAHLLLPVAAAMAAALAVALLRHRGEWDAMRSLGAAQAQLMGPFALAAMILVGVLVLHEGMLLPRAIEESSRFETAQIRGGPVRLGSGAGPRWWWLDGGVLIAEEVSPAGTELTGAHWFALDAQGSVTERIDAATMGFLYGGWFPGHGTSRSMADPRVSEPVQRGLPCLDELTPAGIRRLLVPLAQHDLRSLAADPRPEARYTLHARLAHPVAAGLLLLITAWLVTRIRTGRVLAVAVALGLAATQVMVDLVAGALALMLDWLPLLPWLSPLLLAVTLGGLYLTSSREASERNQPLVQSA